MRSRRRGGTISLSGVDAFVTHHLPLEAAPDAYSSFQKKQDGMIKVMFHP